MRSLRIAAVTAALAVAAGGGHAADGRVLGPPSTSVTYPAATPSGWYTNTYNHAWYYPWYAYYNYNHGPYSNWMAGGGFATYGYCGPAGHFHWPNRVPAQPWVPPEWAGEFHSRYQHLTPHHPLPPGVTPVIPKDQDKKDTPKDKPKDNGNTGARVAVTLPADAVLLFDGAPATGTGAVRTFDTPPLVPGQDYRYVLTAAFVRGGRLERVSETVIVRAGETATVTLSPSVVAPAGK